MQIALPPKFEKCWYFSLLFIIAIWICIISQFIVQAN